MPDILEKFTPHLKSVLTRALSIALENESDRISPLHLLHALYHERGAMAAMMLKEVGMVEEVFAKAHNSGAAEVAPPSPENAPTLSDDARRAVEKAIMRAGLEDHHEIGTEHLLFGLLHIDHPDIQGIFLKSHIHLADLETRLARAFAELNQHSKHRGTATDTQGEPCPDCGGFHEKKGADEQSALEYFGVELTAPSYVQKLDPLIGRDEEIDRLARILCRKAKNNPLLLGEPGVGKTAIVEGLAKRIAEGTAPESLKGHKIFAIDVSNLVAGTTYRGDFEARLLDIMDDIAAMPEAIVFIDELHTIIGAGSAGGALDAANILKPALARGQLRLIGATTNAEYKKHIEPDGAFARRFQMVRVREPDAKETETIIRGLIPHYAAHHGVVIAPALAHDIVDLAHRAFPHKAFPDKAIDLLDEAGSLAGGRVARRTLLRRKEQIAKSVAEQDKKFVHAVAQEDALSATAITESLRTLREELIDIDARLAARSGAVTAETLLTAAARLTGTSAAQLAARHESSLATLTDRLTKRVIGQQHVIEPVAVKLQQARLGLRSSDRPMASFLFVGPSGVGKTELAKALAEEYFGDPKAILRFDMSEFAEPHTISKLIGSPPGYVGFKDRAALTDGIREKPHAIVLFDEIEKAHRDVHHLLLQLLDEGTLHDASGVPASFTNAVIILTTNAGRDAFTKPAVGFGEKVTVPTLERMRAALEDSFKPELLNRLDQISIFKPLSHDDLALLIMKELDQLGKRLRQRGSKLAATKDVARTLAKRANPKHGARDIRRVIAEHVETPLTKALLTESRPRRYALTKKNDRVTLTKR